MELRTLHPKRMGPKQYTTIMTKYTWKTKLNNVSYDSDTDELDYTDEELVDAVSIYKDESLLQSSPVYALLKQGKFYEFITNNKTFRIHKDKKE